MSQQRRKKYLQREKSPVAQKHHERVAKPEHSGQPAIGDLGSPSPECGVLDFYDVEQRASDRFQDVVRMIDERLKI